MSDTYEIVIHGWIRDQTKPVSFSEICTKFATFGFTEKVVLSTLVSLQEKGKIKEGPPQGFINTWQDAS